MIYTAKELFKKGETEYSIKIKVEKKQLFLIERGIYSDEPDPYIDEAYISKKYPNAILTGLSAFSFYNLSDHIPNKFHLATEQHSFPIRRNDVIQSYQDSSYFFVGKSVKPFNGYEIVIYDLERMLIELIK